MIETTSILGNLNVKIIYKLMGKVSRRRNRSGTNGRRKKHRFLMKGGAMFFDGAGNLTEQGMQMRYDTMPLWWWDNSKRDQAYQNYLEGKAYD